MGKKKMADIYYVPLTNFAHEKKQVNKVKCRYKYIPYPKDPDMS